MRDVERHGIPLARNDRKRLPEFSVSEREIAVPATQSSAKTRAQRGPAERILGSGPGHFEPIHPELFAGVKPAGRFGLPVIIGSQIHMQNTNVPDRPVVAPPRRAGWRVGLCLHRSRLHKIRRLIGRAHCGDRSPGRPRMERFPHHGGILQYRSPAATAADFQATLPETARRLTRKFPGCADDRR